MIGKYATPLGNYNPGRKRTKIHYLFKMIANIECAQCPHMYIDEIKIIIGLMSLLTTV